MRILINEITFLLLAAFLVLLGVLAMGILVDVWYKEIILILKATGLTYISLLILRFLYFLIYGKQHR